MELKGKIIQVLELQTGEGRNGTWRKQEYVIETQDQYPKKVCFNLWGDKIDQFGIQSGDDVTVHFDVESREYNGRWYTDVKAWKIDKGVAGADMPPPPPISDAGLTPPSTDAPAPGEDDLPF